MRFISRSEAHRLLTGFDRFRAVVLDFKGVEEIGQGFADETFRVWAAAHPLVKLKPVEMSKPGRLHGQARPPHLTLETPLKRHGASVE